MGRSDNFFALGGHSLLAVQLMSRIQQQLDREIALQQVFSTGSLRELAEQVQGIANCSSSRLRWCRGSRRCRCRWPNSVCGS